MSAILAGLVLLLVYFFIFMRFFHVAERAESINGSIAIALTGFFFRLTFLGVSFYIVAKVFETGYASVLVTFTVGLTVLLNVKLGKDFLSIC